MLHNILNQLLKIFTIGSRRLNIFRYNEHFIFIVLGNELIFQENKFLAILKPYTSYIIW